MVRLETPRYYAKRLVFSYMPSFKPRGTKLAKVNGTVSARAAASAHGRKSVQCFAEIRPLPRALQSALSSLFPHHDDYCRTIPGYQPLLARNAFGSFISRMSRKALRLSAACS